MAHDGAAFPPRRLSSSGKTRNHASRSVPAKATTTHAAFTVTASAERNITLYPVFRAMSDAMAWLPIFFLFFSERLTLSEVLLLEAIYYIAVVILEVPSGYFSDIAGRKRTLSIAAVTLVSAYLCFLNADGFTGFAVGQILIAVNMAFRSGTDTALHFESLQTLGRTEEYGDREATAGKYGFTATAVAALAGGFLGSVDLAWPYWLSLLTATSTLYLVVLFREPAVDDNTEPTNTFFAQLSGCVERLRQPLLLWLFLYSVYMTALVHIPYEFYQPYLRLLENNGSLVVSSAPAMAGTIFALTALVGALASAYSIRLTRWLGLTSLLLIAAAVELAIVTVMALVLHPAIALIIILRSGPMAIATAPVNAAIAPLIANHQRATFLSLQSLAGRLVFALILWAFSLLVNNSTEADWSSLELLLQVSFVGGFVGLLMLFIASRQLSRAC